MASQDHSRADFKFNSFSEVAVELSFFIDKRSRQANLNDILSIKLTEKGEKKKKLSVYG